jgi:hypothetical protein
MRTLLAAAAMLLASSAAQAQYTFEYGGKTIRIDPDRGTVQIPGVYDNTKKAKKSKSDEVPAVKSKQPDTAATVGPSEQQPAAAAAPLPPAPSQAAVPAPAIQAPVPPPLASTADPSTASATAATSSNPAVATTAAPPAPPPSAVQSPPAATNPPPSPVVAVAPPPPAAPQPVLPGVAGNSPVGVWLTEEKEGKVRIEQCGPNLCGYSVDKKTNQNGEQVLINMKPGKDKWSGRILDPNTGSTYDSTIAMKGTDALRVQGCAFGGVFCGGQTWTRVN